MKILRCTRQARAGVKRKTWLDYADDRRPKGLFPTTKQAKRERREGSHAEQRDDREAA